MLFRSIGTAVQKAADTTGKAEEDKFSLEKLLTGKNLLGLGVLGAGGLMGYMNQQRAAEQAKAGGGAAPGAAPGASSGAASDADVVDADFKEVDEKK